jgi:hypothetical protein
MVGVKGNEDVTVGTRVEILRIFTGTDVSVTRITFDTGVATRSQALASPAIKIIAMISTLYFISHLLLETIGFANQMLASMILMVLKLYLFIVFSR